MSTIDAYPLHWPTGWPRVEYPESSNFQMTFARARDGLFHELDLMGASNVILSTNIELRLDGIPYAKRREPVDRGVAIYFDHKSRSMTFACDRWKTVADNTQAIRKTIKALRGIERWGASDMIERAFTGFVALTDQSSETWWSVLGVEEGATQKEVNRAYTRKRFKYHPDKPEGDHDTFIKIKEAYTAYLAE